MASKDFQLIMGAIGDPLAKQTFMKKLQTTIMDILMTFLSLKNVMICNDVNGNLALAVSFNQIY
jgi:hypothetical protein